MPGVLEFIARVREDPPLYARIAADPDSVMEIARAEGFDFDREELVLHLEALLEENRELSDEELERVAGGKDVMATLFNAMKSSITAVTDAKREILQGSGKG